MDILERKAFPVVQLDHSHNELRIQLRKPYFWLHLDEVFAAPSQPASSDKPGLFATILVVVLYGSIGIFGIGIQVLAVYTLTHKNLWLTGGIIVVYLVLMVIGGLYERSSEPSREAGLISPATSEYELVFSPNGLVCKVGQYVHTYAKPVTACEVRKRERENSLVTYALWLTLEGNEQVALMNGLSKIDAGKLFHVIRRFYRIGD